MPTLHDPLMIVTDLDGSLLDHHTYTWEAAQTWLDTFINAGIPVVFCTSKTAAEVAPLQRAMGLSGQPFIAENGAVVKGAKSRSAAESGLDYAAICQTLLRLRDEQHFKFTGFADATENEVADWTGLTPRDAALAKQREGSESIIWRDTPARFAEFQTALETHQLALVQGGRFWHVMNAGQGKGEALSWLLSHYPSALGAPFITIGLGDGPNDAPMLEKVDYAVIIKGYSKVPLTLERQDKEHVFHSAHFGPEGWSDGLAHFLHQE